MHSALYNYFLLILMLFFMIGPITMSYNNAIFAMKLHKYIYIYRTFPGIRAQKWRWLDQLTQSSPTLLLCIINGLFLCVCVCVCVHCMCVHECGAKRCSGTPKYIPVILTHMYIVYVHAVSCNQTCAVPLTYLSLLMHTHTQPLILPLHYHFSPFSPLHTLLSHFTPPPPPLYACGKGITL